MIDASLVERAARGDRAAFDQLARSRATTLFNVARMILREDDLAGDAMQEALVRAWRDLPMLRDVARFDGWLHRLLVRACYDQARRKRRWRFDVPWTDVDVQSGEDDARSLADRDQLGRALARLPVEQRAVLVLRYWLDLSQAEIAETLAIPVGTVKSRANAGIAALRAVIEADMRLSAQPRSRTT
ncbi:MAG: RNA polymerase sigma factor [Chloroflexota bacterium]